MRVHARDVFATVTRFLFGRRRCGAGGRENEPRKTGGGGGVLKHFFKRESSEKEEKKKGGGEGKLKEVASVLVRKRLVRKNTFSRARPPLMNLLTTIPGANELIKQTPIQRCMNDRKVRDVNRGP